MKQVGRRTLLLDIDRCQIFRVNYEEVTELTYHFFFLRFADLWTKLKVRWNLHGFRYR